MNKIIHTGQYCKVCNLAVDNIRTNCAYCKSSNLGNRYKSSFEEWLKKNNFKEQVNKRYTITRFYLFELYEREKNKK